MGTDDAVRPSVVAELESMGIEVERVGGLDRYATAAAAAARVGGSHAYLVRGDGFADAVAVSARAASEDAPILLTMTSSLPAATRDALDGFERVTIVGGTAAVSSAVEGEVEAMGVEVDRIAGADRYETSTLVASGADAGAVWVAGGEAWPDAVAAGPAAAAVGATLVLSPPVGLPSAVEEWLAANESVASAVLVARW